MALQIAFKSAIRVLAVYFLISGVPSFAAITCDENLSNGPSMSDVVTGLERLPEADKNWFFETEWGGPEELASDNDEYGYAKMLSNSLKIPQPFYNKRNQRVGGIGAYRNHIFAEGYYRAQAERIAPLIAQQPWLQWNSENQKYEVRRGYTAEVLLSDYVRDGKVTLYRGLSQEDLKSMLDAQKDPKKFDALFAKRDAIFFSPDKRALNKWAADGIAIELELNTNDFDKIYAGLEYDYVEVALPPDALKNSLSTMRVRGKK